MMPLGELTSEKEKEGGWLVVLDVGDNGTWDIDHSTLV